MGFYTTTEVTCVNNELYIYIEVGLFIHKEYYIHIHIYIHRTINVLKQNASQQDKNDI